MLGTDGIDAGGAEEQVEFAGKLVLDRLDAAGAWDFKDSAEAAFKADVGDDLFRAAMLMEHLGAAFRGEFTHLLGLAAKVNRSRGGSGWKRHRKLDRLAFEIGYGEVHNMSLRRGVPGVNAQTPATKDTQFPGGIDCRSAAKQPGEG